MTTVIPAPVSDNTLQQNELATIKGLSDLLISVSPDDPNGRGPLWHSWRFLQIYSTWGLRMPYTEAHLGPRLGIKSPGQFEFFPLMLEAYGLVHHACYLFQTEAFPEVVKLGRSILDYAEDARPEGGGVFDLLISLLDKSDLAAAHDLILDLQATAKTNIERAQVVELKLNAFSSQLVDAQGKLKECDTLIEKDKATSQATIAQMTGGAEVKGSLLNLKKLLTEKQAEYDHAVVVASTTVTYAWVWPFGPIAAAIVAGIYGDKAVKALEEVHRQTSKLKGEDSKLYTAIQTHQSQEMAHSSVNQVMSITGKALDHVGTVKNAWVGIVGSLGVIEKKVLAMTSGTDEATLKGKALVKNYAQAAGKQWATLIEPLTDLTVNPYLKFEEAEKSMDEFANNVRRDDKSGLGKAVVAGKA